MKFVRKDPRRWTRQSGDFPLLSSHFGRRCQHVDAHGARCAYYWTSKDCPKCAHANDIAARYCTKCREELVNPNEKLIAEFKAYQRDPTNVQCEAVLSMDVKHGLSRGGDAMATVTFTTPYRKFAIYLLSHTPYLQAKAQPILAATGNLKNTPRTVTYRKSGTWWEVLGFDERTDYERLSERTQRAGGSVPVATP